MCKQSGVAGASQILDGLKNRPNKVRVTYFYSFIFLCEYTTKNIYNKNTLENQLDQKNLVLIIEK